MANIHHLFLFFFISLQAAAIQISHADNYIVTNTATKTPGGSRFTTAIGDTYMKQKMNSSTYFIWAVFKQRNPEDRKVLPPIVVVIDNDIDDADVAYTSNNEIHLNAKYIEGYTGDVKTEITGVLYHEMTHVWQWNGNGHANGGLIEGIADYIRLKAGYAPSHWVKRGQGDRWDQGYDVTALFLDYCNSLRNGFVADLNKKMRNDYVDSYFVDLLGKSVDQLWADYKAINKA